MTARVRTGGVRGVRGVRSRHWYWSCGRGRGIRGSSGAAGTAEALPFRAATGMRGEGKEARFTVHEAHARMVRGLGRAAPEHRAHGPPGRRWEKPRVSEAAAWRAATRRGCAATDRCARAITVQAHTYERMTSSASNTHWHCGAAGGGRSAIVSELTKGLNARWERSCAARVRTRRSIE